MNCEKERLKFSRRDKNITTAWRKKTSRYIVAQYSQEQVGISRRTNTQVMLRIISIFERTSLIFKGDLFQIFTRIPTIFQESTYLRISFSWTFCVIPRISLKTSGLCSLLFVKVTNKKKTTKRSPEYTATG